VNLHGCKVHTAYHVPVGMLVTLECPKAGTKGKAVCVKVWDAPGGVGDHEIALQLVEPQNLWGVPNPPADWGIVATSMVEGPPLKAESATQAAAPASPFVPPPPPVATAAPPPAAVPPVPPAGPSPLGTVTIDLRLAELEGRSAQLLESVLDIIRSQAEELTRTSLEEFRQQVEVLLRDAEERLRQGIQQLHAESASTLTGLRDDFVGQMTSQSAQLIRSAEESLRARFREVLGTPARPAAAGSSKQPPKK